MREFENPDRWDKVAEHYATTAHPFTARFAEADVATFLKFNSARRAFVKLPSRSFSLTTDAVMLSASVLPKNKPVLY